jgi:hypothetical protein
MEPLEGVAERHHVRCLPQRRGQHILDGREHQIQVLLDDAADDPMAEALRRRIDRNHDSLPLARLARLARLGQHDRLPRHDLSAVVVLHRPGDEQQLSGLDRAVEERLARPGTLEDPRPILQDRAEDPEPPARGQHALGHDVAHDRDVPSDRRLGDRGHRARVEVAVGCVVQQIFHGVYAEARKRLGAPRADPLEELDGGVGPKRHQSAISRSA